jgi:hypothetical protein
MDYCSSLGPIDPQVYNGKTLVPALGYLDQFEKLVEKSINKNIYPAELQLLRDMDLADLANFEQARNLSISLIKQWLITYKFKNWNIHSSNSINTGKEVTEG